MTRSKRLCFLFGLAVLILCAAAAAPRARALWEQLPSGAWIEEAEYFVRHESSGPDGDALYLTAAIRPAPGCTGTVAAELRMIFRAWRGGELMGERVLESAL